MVLAGQYSTRRSDKLVCGRGRRCCGFSFGRKRWEEGKWCVRNRKDLDNPVRFGKSKVVDGEFLQRQWAHMRHRYRSSMDLLFYLLNGRIVVVSKAYMSFS